MTTNKRPDIERIREILHYNPETGILTWLERRDYLNRRNTRYAGKNAGCMKRDGGLVIGIKVLGFNGYMEAHIVAWALYYGSWPECNIDHKDRCRSHNWIDNLRIATVSENQCNRSQISKLGYKGVNLSQNKHKKYRATITLNRKSIFIGSYHTATEAAEAYDKKATELHGPFACTNKMLGLL